MSLATLLPGPRVWDFTRPPSAPRGPRSAAGVCGAGPCLGPSAAGRTANASLVCFATCLDLFLITETGEVSVLKIVASRKV